VVFDAELNKHGCPQRNLPSSMADSRALPQVLSGKRF
jgi:hypothetical protein